MTDWVAISAIATILFSLVSTGILYLTLKINKTSIELEKLSNSPLFMDEDCTGQISFDKHKTITSYQVNLKNVGKERATLDTMEISIIYRGINYYINNAETNNEYCYPGNITILWDYLDNVEYKKKYITTKRKFIKSFIKPTITVFITYTTADESDFDDIEKPYFTKLIIIKKISLYQEDMKK